MERSRSVGETNLKQSKDTPILTKQKNLNQVIADPRRESFENWLAALARAKKLRRRGYDVKLPPPHLGRPPFLLIKTPAVVIVDSDRG
jgi:ADP-heptose:LPS heptosyltransferase